MIVDSYEAVDAGTIVHNKVANLTRPFTKEVDAVESVFVIARSYLDSGPDAVQERQSAWGSFRIAAFFDLLPALGLMGLGPVCAVVVWLRRVRGRRRMTALGEASSVTDELIRTVGLGWLLVAVSIVTWALVLFGPSTTVLHQGTYFLPMVAFASGLLSVWAFSRPLALLLVAVQSAGTVALYWHFTPDPSFVPKEMLPRAISSVEALAWMAMAATAAAIAFIAFHRWSSSSLPALSGETANLVATESSADLTVSGQ